MAAAAAVWLLGEFRALLWPFALALLTVILLRAPLRMSNRLARAAVLTLCGGVGIAFVVGATVVVPSRLSEAAGLAPAVLSRLDAILLDLSARIDADHPISLRALISSADIRTAAGFVFAGLRDAAAGLILAALFSVLLLACWRQIRLRAEILGLGSRPSKVSAIIPHAVRGVEDYFWVQTVTALANAVGGAAVMAVFGLNDWFAWSVALFVLAYAPFIGVALGSVAPALAALLQFDTPWPALWIFLVIQVVAFFVGNLLAPKLQADRQNLDPSTSLLAVAAWTLLWGVPGTLLAIPLTIVLMHALAATTNWRWIAVMMSNDGRPGVRSG